MHNGICGADAFLGELDLDAVREIHVACGTEDRGLRVDVHSRVTRDETLELLQHVLSMTPNVEAVIFEILGPAVPSVGVETIAAELQRVRRVVQRGTGVTAARRRYAGAAAGAPMSTGLPLAELQRAMRDLIHHDVIADDPYIAAAARSTGLAVTRDTIRGWLRFRLDRNCRLTAAILRRQGGYDEVLSSTERGTSSPFIEQLTAVFLNAACERGDALVRSVASFERALLRDDDAEERIDWPCNPYTVLGALLQGDDLPELPPAPHQTIVSRRINGLFEVRSAG